MVATGDYSEMGGMDSGHRVSEVCGNYYPAFAAFVVVRILAGLPLTPAIETETPTCEASALILAMASCLRRSVLVFISSWAQVITCERSASDSAFTVSCVMLFPLP
jgi:hypothetical protein